MQAESEALNTTKQQRVYLETLLGQYKALSGGSRDKDVPLSGLAEVDDRLDKLQTHLFELSSTYGDQYPEVRKVKDQIAKTEAERDRLLANQKASGNKESADASTPAAGYAERGPRDPSTVAQLQSQLKANQIEVKDREKGIAALSAKIGEYQGRLNQEPIREQQLADLTRGYDQSKASYDNLLKKKNDSAMATSMERLQQGERFRIIDPPSLPLKPTFPNRLKFCGIGLLVGLALGAGTIVVAEMMDDRVYSDLELRRLLPVPVLSELPVICDPADQAREKRQEWVSWAATAAVVATILAGTAASYFKG